ncbi:MutS protein msh5, partial [Coelomomyces lativittatus]
MSYLQQPTSPLPPTTNISSPPNQNQPTFSTPHDEPWTSSLFLSTHSFLHRTILAIQQERDQLGFAFYDGEEHTLCVASRDLTELSSSGLTLLQKVKALVRPSMIITHSKCADTFMDALAIPVGHTVIPIELVPWHDFALKSSKWKLIQLQQKWLDTHSFSKTDPCASASDMQPIFTTTTTPTTTSTTPSIATSTFHWSDRSMQAEAIVLSKFNHVYSPLTLGCIGALLGFLTKLEEKEEEERPTTTPSDPHDLTDGSTTPWDVTSLTLFHLEDYMHLHPYDLEAFTIFADPASLIQSPACIFDLLNHTRSSDGKYMLRKWLLRPLASKTLIEHRFQVIQFLLLPQHTPLILQCQLALSKIRSLPVIFKKPRMDINDWHALFQFTRAVPKLHEPLHTCQADSVPFLNTLLATMDLPLLHHLFQMMMDVIDFDRSFPQKTCMVKPGLHAGLDEKKKLDAQLPVLLSKVATSLNLPLDPSLQGHLNVLYFPQLGYLISIPSPKVSAIAPRLLDLEFQFRSPSNAFFKNEKMRELDVELGDVRGAIVDLEIEIFQELYEQIKPCQAYLLDLHQKLTEFD